MTHEIDLCATNDDNDDLSDDVGSPKDVVHVPKDPLYDPIHEILGDWDLGFEG